MSTNGLEPVCRGERELPDPYAPGPSELTGFRRAARTAIQYEQHVTAARTAGRLLPLRQKLGAASAVTAIQGVKAASAVPSRGASIPALTEVQALCEGAA